MEAESNLDYSDESIDDDLSPSEEHVLLLLKEMKEDVIWVNNTQIGIIPGTLDLLKTYYSDTESSHILDSLVRKGKLLRIDHGIMLLCPKCGTHEVMILLSCPCCGDTKLREKRKIVHTSCQHMGTFDEFCGGHTITCPVCNEELESDMILDPDSGFSYGDPYFECQKCGFTSNKAKDIFLCKSCKTKYEKTNAIEIEQTGYKINLKPIKEQLKTIPEDYEVEESKMVETAVDLLEIGPEQLEKITETQIPQQQCVNIEEYIAAESISEDGGLLDYKIKILIVEDDELSNYSLKFILESILENNCEINTRYDGQKVVEEIEQMNYDLVFLDNKLPHKYGLTILQELKDRDIKTNVIFMTGFSDEETVIQAMKLGAKDYLSKGNITVETLTKVISEICESTRTV